MKILTIVIDGFGIGADSQSVHYGDEHTNTYVHIYEKTGVKLDNLVKLGLNNIDGVNIECYPNPMASYGRLAEKSVGKDTTTGHWEIAGIITENPFPTFPNGFPKAIIDKFEKAINKKILCNKPYSGTEVIKDYGDEHTKTQCPIIYTSADSVFQIACNTDIVPLETLYEYCQKARELLTGDYAVSRVIARPFIVRNGEYIRTEYRRDYSLKPPYNLLDKVCENGYDCVGVGKIEDIFSYRGLTQSFHTTNNLDGIGKIKELLKSNINGFIFVNLVDTDMHFGHRNDYIGYAKSLKEFDNEIPAILELLQNDDILIICSDHGCDPTDTSTDHSREYVPLLIYEKNVKSQNLGTINGFDFIAKFITKKLNIL